MTNALTLKDLPPPPPNKSGWPWTTRIKPLPDKMPDGSPWPRLSIITPSYNQGQFLEATIRSVLLQGYPNLEYIIIDGGSSDRSIEILKKYDKHLFYWHSRKDGGQSDALNQGIEKSSGKILGWINSDDVYVKAAFHKIVKAFQSHPDCIVVHGNRILLDEAGQITGWACLPPFDPTTLLYNICCETVFWKRYAMEEVGFFNPNLQFAMDLEFFGRLYKYGKFLKLNEYLGYFRCYPESKSSRLALIGIEEAVREWKNLFDCEPITSQLQSNKSFLDLLKVAIEPIKYPTLIGLPYLFHRISKNVRFQS